MYDQRWRAISTLRGMREERRAREDRRIEDAAATAAARRPPDHLGGKDLGMATTHPPEAERARHAPKPAAGRPALFAVLLVVAALGMLGLLVAGPSITLPLAIGSAAALMTLVAFAWVVAGPRL